MRTKRRKEDKNDDNKERDMRGEEDRRVKEKERRWKKRSREGWGRK